MNKFEVGDRVRVRPYKDVISERGLRDRDAVSGIPFDEYRADYEGQIFTVQESIAGFAYFLSAKTLYAFPHYALERVDGNADQTLSDAMAPVSRLNDCSVDKAEPQLEVPALMNIDILGAKYRVYERAESSDPLLKDCDGYTDWTSKKIVVKSGIEGTLDDIGLYQKKVLRHEIVHAFMFESGLAESTGAFNEQLVDWVAWQGPKIFEAWQKAGCMDR